MRYQRWDRRAVSSWTSMRCALLPIMVILGSEQRASKVQSLPPSEVRPVPFLARAALQNEVSAIAVVRVQFGKAFGSSHYVRASQHMIRPPSLFPRRRTLYAPFNSERHLCVCCAVSPYDRGVRSDRAPSLRWVWDVYYAAPREGEASISCNNSTRFVLAVRLLSSRNSHDSL
jgi:hypothetical protein